jgi:hypothetical protein
MSQTSLRGQHALLLHVVQRISDCLQTSSRHSQTSTTPRLHVHAVLLLLTPDCHVLPLLLRGLLQS